MSSSRNQTLLHRNAGVVELNLQLNGAQNIAVDAKIERDKREAQSQQLRSRLQQYRTAVYHVKNDITALCADLVGDCGYSVRSLEHSSEWMTSGLVWKRVKKGHYDKMKIHGETRRTGNVSVVGFDLVGKLFRRG